MLAGVSEADLGRCPLTDKSANAGWDPAATGETTLVLRKGGIDEKTMTSPRVIVRLRDDELTEIGNRMKMSGMRKLPRLCHAHVHLSVYQAHR